MRGESGDTWSELVAYAMRRIAAHRFPGDRHTPTVFECPKCGVTPFRVTIEHHTGSKRRDFKGVIYGSCARCGAEARLFSFTGAHRQFLREEKPTCSCGQETFIVAMVERIEREPGLPGFFDEGVIVGQCAACAARTTFVYTD